MCQKCAKHRQNATQTVFLCVLSYRVWDQSNMAQTKLFILHLNVSKPPYKADNITSLKIVFIYASYLNSKLLANLSDNLKKILLKEEILIFLNKYIFGHKSIFLFITFLMPWRNKNWCEHITIGDRKFTHPVIKLTKYDWKILLTGTKSLPVY